MSKFIICEKTETNENPIRNDYGFVSVFKDEDDADFERMYLQPDHDNLLVVREGK